MSFDLLRPRWNPLSYVVASEVLPMRLETLDGEITPYVLEGTPDVLTIGGRCVNERYRFEWPPFSKTPYFE